MERSHPDVSIVRNPYEQNLKVFHSPELTSMRRLLETKIAAEQLTENTEQVQFYQQVVDCLNMVQEDTLMELQLATTICSNFQKDCWKDSTFITKATVFTLISNVFNRGDALIEEINGRNDSLLDASMTEKIWNHGLSAVTIRDQKRQRVSPGEQIALAARLAEEIDLPTDTWQDKIQTIKTHHAKSLEMLRAFRKDHIPYSVHDALDIRRNTVGVYVRLLADVLSVSGMHHRYNSNEIVRYLALIQAADDRYDIDEDVLTQVNPFVASIIEVDLLEACLAQTNVIKHIAHANSRYPRLKYALFFRKHRKMKKVFENIASDYELSWVNIP